MELDKQIEAVLFWRGEPVTVPELCRTLKQTSGEVKKALQTLTEKLSGRGVALVQAGNEVSLATASEAHELIERLRTDELSRDLSRAALETLSIVLYKGEVRRRDIDYIRGVNSGAIVRSLLIRGLIERTQNADGALPAHDAQAGRMFFYRPTVELLSLLGVKRTEDLPEHAAIRAELEAAHATQEEEPVEMDDMR